jgi:hypothetical protein
LIFALKEAVPLQIPYHLPATRAIAVAENRSGPTAEDYAAFQHAVTLFFSDIRTAMAPQSSATTLNFIKTDPWISEILEVPYFSTRHGRPAYLAGSLTGFWEGSMMVGSISRTFPRQLSQFVYRFPVFPWETRRRKRLRRPTFCAEPLCNANFLNIMVSPHARPFH